MLYWYDHCLLAMPFFIPYLIWGDICIAWLRFDTPENIKRSVGIILATALIWNLFVGRMLGLEYNLEQFKHCVIALVVLRTLMAVSKRLKG